MGTVTWLHISDLHFRTSQTYDANVVLKALLYDCKECIALDQLRPDFIVVTGDIAFSGAPEEYQLARQFFDDLLQSTNLRKEQLFLVPGNHDVNRSAISLAAQAIGEKLTDRQSANALLVTPADRKLVFARFKGYAAFVKAYLGKEWRFDDRRYFYVQRLNLAGQQIALLGLNSAWLCASDQDKSDGLLIGERQARAALEQADGADLKIALLHHPFDWLREFDQNDSVAMLTDGCDFILHGHLHQTAATQLMSPDSAATILACGACYETREFPNMYNWVQLDLAAGSGTVYLRRYSDLRGGFWAKDTLAYRNAPDGTYTFPLPSRLSPSSTLSSLTHLRILAIVAAPITGHIDGDSPQSLFDPWAEWRRLENAIRSGWDVAHNQAASWTLVRLNPPTPANLLNALAHSGTQSTCQIVHVRGYGTPEGLVLEDDLGRAALLTNDQVVALFRKTPVQLIVLDVCHSEEIARRLHEEAEVPAVIAITENLYHDEAQLFMTRLYTGLALGWSAAKAFAEAVSALRCAYEWAEAPIPQDEMSTQEPSITERLTIPICLGNTQLALLRAKEHTGGLIVNLTEPPSRGIELHLIEDFVGRASELVCLARWLRDRPSPVIALSGLGGIGKSALAAMAVLRGSWRFRSVVAISARDTPDLQPDALTPLLDGVLGRGGELTSALTENERKERAIALLNQVPVLLVLDNFEDLSETVTWAWHDFLSRLDPRRSSVAVLTLRPAVKHPLTDLAGPSHLSLQQLNQPDALRLLVEGLELRQLWGKVPSQSELTLSERKQLEARSGQAHLGQVCLGYFPALEELAERAGRHPYALRLALGDLGYPHVDWEKALNNVSNLQGGDWEAQAEALVGRMVADLNRNDPDAVALLCAHLNFQGGASYEALKNVFLPGANIERFDDHLRAALDASLLEHHQRTDRYELHPLTRSFLKKRSFDRDDPLVFEYRYMEYFREWIGQHAGEYNLLEREIPNLTNAFRLMCHKQSSSELIFALWDNWFFITRGYWKEYDLWTRLAVEAMERLGNEQTKARILVDWGCLLTEQYRLAEAKRVLTDGQGILERLGRDGDTGRLCTAILFQGYVAFRQQEYQLAVEHANDTRKIAQENGYHGIFASATSLLAQIAEKEGRGEEALDFYDEAENVLREIEDRRRLASLLMSKGTLELRLKHPAAAKSYLQDSLGLAQATELPHIAAGCKLRLAAIARTVQDYDTALQLAREAMSAFYGLGIDRDAKRAKDFITELESSLNMQNAT